MTAVLYPMGYGFTLGTMEQMMASLTAHGHPEFVRRIGPWLEAQDGRVGIGNAWRATQPVRPGFAPDGKSFHQTQSFASGVQASAAVDLVVQVVGGAHRAPYWKEVPAQGSAAAKLWGVHCNIGGTEPWHMQPVELDGWQSWVNGGRKDPVAGYKIPSDPPTLIVDAPPPTLKLNVDNLNDVRWLQQIMNERWQAGLKVDGQFGPGTETAVKNMQKVLGGSVDGVYGPKTAGALAGWLNGHSL